MKFCSLKERYSLRGWIGMPYALCCNHSAKPLNREQFHALLQCDGQRDLDNAGISDEMKQALDTFEKEGVIEYHDEPRELR